MPVFETPDLSIEVLSHNVQFEEIGKEWNDFVGQANQASVFYLHDWFSAALQWPKAHSELSVVLIRKNGSIVTVCPLVRRIQKIATIQIRILEFLMVPETQESDFICSSGLENVAAKCIVKWLQEEDNWDILDLRRLPPGSFVEVHLVPHIADASLPVVLRNCDRNFTLSLRSTWHEYYSQRSRRLKRGNNHIANRIAKQFRSIEVNVAQMSEVTDEERDIIARDVVSISSKSWKRDATDTSFAAAGPRAFLDKLLATLRMRRYLHVWRLMLDSRCVATEVQLVKDGVVSALRADYDSKYQASSPGTYLNKEILKQQFGKDLIQYRMGPGPNAYKMRWSEDTLDLQNLRVYSRTSTGFLLQVYERNLRPILDSARQLSRVSKSQVIGTV